MLTRQLPRPITIDRTTALSTHAFTTRTLKAFRTRHFARLTSISSKVSGKLHNSQKRCKHYFDKNFGHWPNFISDKWYTSTAHHCLRYLPAVMMIIITNYYPASMGPPNPTGHWAHSHGGWISYCKYHFRWPRYPCPGDHWTSTSLQTVEYFFEIQTDSWRNRLLYGDRNYFLIAQGLHYWATTSFSQNEDSYTETGLPIPIRLVRKTPN